MPTHTSTIQSATLRVTLLALLVGVIALLLPLPRWAMRDHSSPQSASRTVLFIGNSLTYSNDIPGKMLQLADTQVGRNSLYIESLSYPGVTLEWQEHNPDTLQALKNRLWDVVVLQEQSSRSFDDQSAYYQSLERFLPLVREHARKIILYAISSHDWPQSQQEELDLFNACAAKKYNLQLAAISDLWRAIEMRFPDFPLYESDRHHPGKAAN
jgi:hypothetical protein